MTTEADRLTSIEEDLSDLRIRMDSLEDRTAPPEKPEPPVRHYRVLERTGFPRAVEICGPNLNEIVPGFPCAVTAEQFERWLEAAYAAGAASCDREQKP